MVDGMGSSGPTTFDFLLMRDVAVEETADDTERASLQANFEAFLPGLRRLARRLTRNVADAEDLVDDCVERGLAKRHPRSPGTDVQAWLFTILRNLHLDQMRSAARRKEICAHMQNRTDFSCPTTQYTWLQLRELERAIRLMSDAQREPVLFLALEQGTYCELASARTVPMGTIRSRLSPGRQRLRELTDAEVG